MPHSKSHKPQRVRFHISTQRKAHWIQSSHLYLACFHNTNYVQPSISLYASNLSRESNRIAPPPEIGLTSGHLPILGRRYFSHIQASSIVCETISDRWNKTWAQERFWSSRNPFVNSNILYAVATPKDNPVRLQVRHSCIQSDPSPHKKGWNKKKMYSATVRRILHTWWILRGGEAGQVQPQVTLISKKLWCCENGTHETSFKNT